jgi:glycosyltransferase involved in cell wall biosynthesis
MRILHVLTVSGSHGEYGGPNKVARELCSELQGRGHLVEILSGAIAGSEPIRNSNLIEDFVLVKPLSKRFPISSLWSNKIAKEIYIRIKFSDLVHIHFARDLIPITAAIFCVLLRKPFVTQTHGMVKADPRFSTRIIDLIFTRRLLKHSRVNFVLTNQEIQEMGGLKLRSNLMVLPNGIRVADSISSHKKNVKPKIIFCSRIQARKRPDRFIKLAQEAETRNLDLDFEIMGPDGGVLKQILRTIDEKNISNLTYGGALDSDEVSKKLSECDLLVLPSENEPFPMIVLESLAVGTPVLIMPSCGIAKTIAEKFDEFVAPSDDFEGLLTSFLSLEASGFNTSRRSRLQDFCRYEFGIVSVTNELEQTYQTAIWK